MTNFLSVLRKKKKVNKNLVSLAGLLDRFRRIMGTGLWFIMIWS